MILDVVHQEQLETTNKVKQEFPNSIGLSLHVTVYPEYNGHLRPTK